MFDTIFRKALLLSVLVIAVMFSVQSAVGSNNYSKRHIITEAFVSFDDSTIVITGMGFNELCEPKVTLGADPMLLMVQSFSASQIVVDLPAVADGDYLLQVGIRRDCDVADDSEDDSEDGDDDSDDESVHRYSYLSYDLTIGAVGPQGEQGKLGDQGPQGKLGDQGPQGKLGDQGPQGKLGDTGAQGPQGKLGDQGPQGKLGDQGPQGKLGDTGAQGPQGKLGDQGPQGKLGDQGPQGKLGDTGAQGPQGKLGDQGPQGKLGDQGPQGKLGDQGPQGEQGKIGPSGEDGTSCEIGECQSPGIATLTCGDTSSVHVPCVPSGIVFVTSATFQGNLGGSPPDSLEGGDQQCNIAAAAATPPLPGTYVAWLSDKVTDASSRITDQAYRTTSGNIVATSLSDLTDSILLAPINADENGVVLIGPQGVWTGTNPDGTTAAFPFSGGPNPNGVCGDAIRPDWKAIVDFRTGYIGDANQTDGLWTFKSLFSCNNRARLYCFQVEEQ